MMMDDGIRLLRAKMLPRRVAILAVRAGAALPAQSDALADLEFRDFIPFGRHSPDDLMARHERVLRHAPFIIDHRQIAVTDPAMGHRNLHLIPPQHPRFV
jgi:hypothetical protein